MPLPALTLPMVLTLGIALGALVLFVWNRLPFEVIGLLVMASLAVFQILTPTEAISGFSNEATVTVAAILFLSAGLERTGVVDALGRLIAKLGAGSELRLQSVLVAMVAPASAFLNNTAVVAMLLPVARDLGRQRDIPTSRLLMPISFASQLGGTLTLIGTSTNLLVAGLLVDFGLPSLRLFEITPAAAPLAIAGLLYLLTVGRALLPSRRGPADEGEVVPHREFLAILAVEDGSPLVGLPIGEAEFLGKSRLKIVRIQRPLRADPLRKDEPLESGDLLHLVGTSEALGLAAMSGGLRLPGARTAPSEEETREQVVVEALVSPRSSLLGRRVRSVGPFAWYGATVLAFKRHGVQMERPMNTTFEPGDLLLLQGSRGALQRMQRSGLLLLMGKVDVPQRDPWKARLATGIFIAVIALAAVGLMPILVSAILGVIAMLLTGCLRPGDAFEQIDWGVLILLGTIIPLGLALQKTEAALLLAGLILSAVQDAGPHVILGAVYLLTSILTEFISNNATVVLLVPVAFAIAGAVGLSPLPFAIAVMFAGSNSFMTPVGYQTNTFIFGPGNYRFTDFARVGGLLSLLMLVLAVWIIPIFFPF